MRLCRPLPAVQGDTLHIVGVGDNRIGKRSLKMYLINTVRAVNDQALKDIDWKPLVGIYLVKCKYLVLRWIEDDETPRSLPQLGRELQKIAAETDVRRIPDYTPVGPSALINAIRDFERVKDHLVEGDRASMVIPDGEHIDFNLSTRLDVDDIEALEIKEIQVHSVASMVLIVRKPDYLGTSMWDLRHGKHPISAKIEHEEWLGEFQNRKVDVRPGDALKCTVRIELMLWSR